MMSYVSGISSVYDWVSSVKVPLWEELTGVYDRYPELVMPYLVSSLCCVTRQSYLFYSPIIFCFV
jgi:hypothetical protein